MSKQIEWYRQATGDATVNAVAAKAGLVGSTLSRQIKGDALTPETVVAVARAYDADPIDGLIVLGLITEEEVVRRGAAVVLADLTDRMLADEVYDRMIEGRGVRDFEAPTFEIVQGMAAKTDKDGPLDGQGASSDA